MGKAASSKEEGMRKASIEIHRPEDRSIHGQKRALVNERTGCNGIAKDWKGRRNGDEIYGD